MKRIDSQKDRKKKRRVSPRLKEKIGGIRPDDADKVRRFSGKLRIVADIERRIVGIEGDETEGQKNAHRQDQQPHKFVDPAMFCRHEIASPTHSFAVDDSNENQTRKRGAPQSLAQFDNTQTRTCCVSEGSEA